MVSIFDFFEKMVLPYAYSFTINSDYKSNANDTYFAENQFESINKELEKVMDYFVLKIANRERIFCTGIIRKLNAIKYKQIRTHSCEAGRTSLTVDETGSYFACQNMLPYKQSIMGNVDAGIDNEARTKFMSKDLKELSGCTQCNIRNLCGGCEVERINSNCDPNNQMCKFAQIEWKNILYAYSRIMEIKEQKSKRMITQYYN